MLCRTSRFVPSVILCLAGLAIIAGCTPEEEQAIRDALNTAVQGTIQGGFDFVIGFARQALAAFLF
ncbi:MAG: hypothetical protein L6R00_17340 [Phycisphaerae bacterium]|nr:hypothetical protein [Phycisphaerae bacterium]